MQENIKTSGLVISFVLLFSLTMLGQQELVIKHRFKPNKQKSLKLKKEYTIITTDSIYKKIKIIDFTDTSMMIVRHWTFNDTIQESFAEIEMIEKHWSVHKDLYGVSAHLLIFSIFFLGATAYSFAFEDADEANRITLFIGVLLAVPFTTFTIINHIKNKYDLQDKWEFAEKQVSNP